MTSNTNNATIKTTETEYSQVHPESWTRLEVIDWIKWCSTEYALHDIPINKFEMNGKALCMLTEDMFKQRVPNSGDILYRALKNLLPKQQQQQQQVNYEFQLPDIKLEDTTLICATNTQHSAQSIESLNASNIANTNQTNNTSNLTTNININENKVKETKMKPNTDTSSVSLQSSSLLLQKTTSKFMPLITIQNKNLNKKHYDYENENDMTDNLDDEDDDDDSMHQQQQTSPNSTSSKQALNTNSPNFERKRTANLENLIGNLKVRKLNQTTNSKYNKMTSLYVDIAGAGAQSMSDCSPSTPPLSSPSVSPSSLSIASDSPNHASSFSSSSSLVNQTNDNKQRYSMVPKFRWIIESGSDIANYPQNDLKTLQNQATTLSGFDPVKLNEIMNESSPLWLNTEQQVKTTPTKPVKLTKKQQQQLDKPVHKPGSLSTGHKNQEDPSRQIKFYDDFIDFRGDVLRRPPDSKNCRILWEYLYLLLQNTNYSTVIRWEDETNMVFRIVQAEKLAALWGLQKNRLGMTYEKLSRGMRYYYPNNIIAREPGRRLLYRFMRHPDEIKKFVKKNGTYMLKRAKMNAKNNESIETINTTNLDESIRTDLNPDDSGVDEPGSINKSKQSKKKTNDTIKQNENKNKNHSKNMKTMSNIKQETNNDNEDEYPDEQVDEDIEDEDLDNLGDNRNRDDSTIDEEVVEQNSYKIDSSSSSSPYSGISHENNTTNGEMKTNSQAAAALFAAAANAMTGANRLYPDFNAVNDLFQYYAAAAGLQQQSPSMASTYISRLFNKTSSQSNKDDVHAAQSLMQLKCNQNDNQLNFNSFDINNNNQFLSETIKNFTNLTRNNITNTNMQKTKRSPVARSNDISSASSTSSNSSLEHSIDYENNNEFRNQARKLNKQPKMEDMHANYEYPLNLSVSNSNNNTGNNNVKKRKSKYDIKVTDI